MVPKFIRRILLLGTLTCFFFGLAGNQSQDPPNVQVKGIWGESVLLSVNITSTKPWSKIKWFYDPETKEGNKIKIAEISEGELKRTNPDDRFGQRLKMVNQTTLGIVDLKAEDSGVYTAEVQFVTAVIGTHRFTLTVYDKCEVGWYMYLAFPYCFSRTSLVIISALCVFVIVVCLCLWRWREKIKRSILEGCLAWCPPLLDQEEIPTQPKRDI